MLTESPSANTQMLYDQPDELGDLPLLSKESLIESIHQLPSFPAVVLELISMVHRPDIPLDAVVDTVGMDQALTARILQLANSPFYGRSGRVSSIRDGVNMLGLRQLASLVLAASLTLQFEKIHGASLHMTEFWQHSIACAVGARLLANEHGLDEGAAFAAGLLHDVGRLVLSSHSPDVLVRVQRWAKEHHRSLSEAERCWLGVSHAEVGGWVTRHWHFESEVIDAIAHHHTPPPTGAASLVDVVHVANALALSLDRNDVNAIGMPDIEPCSWSRLQLNPDKLKDYPARIHEERQALMSALKLN